MKVTKKEMREVRDFAKLLEKRIHGRGLAGGFEVFAYVALRGAPPEVREAMRDAFMAGVDHLWCSINRVAETGTDAEHEEHMDKVEAEIEQWRERFKLRIMDVEGSA